MCLTVLPAAEGTEVIVIKENLEDVLSSKIPISIRSDRLQCFSLERKLISTARHRLIHKTSMITQHMTLT